MLVHPGYAGTPWLCWFAYLDLWLLKIYGRFYTILVFLFDCFVHWHFVTRHIVSGSMYVDVYSSYISYRTVLSWGLPLYKKKVIVNFTNTYVYVCIDSILHRNYSYTAAPKIIKLWRVQKGIKQKVINLNALENMSECMANKSLSMRFINIIYCQQNSL